ncbi:hypothetical protein E4U32_000047 [Claviceps aff. humidiphila group G2b]|nr:hypothetical protein E4U32_000047 [Claviceps aff. humidiphila group G2b]
MTKCHRHRQADRRSRRPGALSSLKDTLTTSFVMTLLRRTKQYLDPPPPPSFQFTSRLGLQHILRLRLRP